MATIEMMTPRSPPDLGVPAPVAAGDAARNFVAARREALGDRWLLGLGPALASAAAEQGDATAALVDPAPSLVEPFGEDVAGAEPASDNLQWLLDELVVRALLFAAALVAPCRATVCSHQRYCHVNLTAKCGCGCSRTGRG